MALPIVAVVGRPNVGKSTLFNKLIGQRLSIVEDTPGVTRDRIYSKCEWRNKEFMVVDTGGIEPDSDDVILAQMRRQSELAIEKADVIVFVTDIRCGVTADDHAVAQMLLKSGKPVILAVNKVDTLGEPPMELYEFYNLGLGDPYPISSVHGHGTGDMLDAVFDYLPDGDEAEYDEEYIKVAVIGKPNAGKSSLVNKIAGEERVIVSNIAGTTRDSTDTVIENEYGKFVFIDTAGIRKKAKVTEDLEYYSVVRSIRAIENSDVCILMLDATRGIESQDLNIFSLVQKNKKGLVVCVNKWDLVESKTNADIKGYENAIRERLAPFTDFPIIFTSAVTKQRIFKVMETALHVYENKNRKVPTAKLNENFLPLIENYPPPAWKGKYIKIKYCTQLPNTQIPTFVFFANLPQYVKEPYRRFLENKLREWWDFNGTPVQLFIRAK